VYPFIDIVCECIFRLCFWLESNSPFNYREGIHVLGMPVCNAMYRFDVTGDCQCISLHRKGANGVVVCIRIGWMDAM
jgi:hypothetical protein